MFEINWSDSATNSIKDHPLYLKYKNDTISVLSTKVMNIKADLDTIPATAQNVYIIAYYSWLLRLITLRGP
jgi:hypothetical protein